MSLISVLRTGTSGMNAQSNRISTVAENIQNSSTTGYKRNATEFSSLLIDGGSTSNYTSGAVETAIRRSVGEQGPISFTTSKTDLAIQGNGFFVVQDETGAPSLTRAGNFVKNEATGDLVNAGGFTLMGYALDAAGEPSPAPALNSTDGMVPVNVASLGLKATESKSANVAGNLPSDAPALVGTLSLTNFTKKTSIVTYDRLGNTVTLDVAMGKSPAPAVNEWTANVYERGGGQVGTTIPLKFDADGQLSGADKTAAAMTYTATGRAPFTIDFGEATQLAAEYDLEGKADGKAPSAVTGSEFAADGTVYAIYEDNTKLAVFRVAVADVGSPDNLEPRAGNIYRTTATSGDMQIGFAGLGGRGEVKSGALEQSNVDVSTELTSMIESQTVYTANSKVFMTGNEMLDTLMNLKR